MSVRRAFILNKSPARKRACEIKARLTTKKRAEQTEQKYRTQPPQQVELNGTVYCKAVLVLNESVRVRTQTRTATPNQNPKCRTVAKTAVNTKNGRRR